MFIDKETGRSAMSGKKKVKPKLFKKGNKKKSFKEIDKEKEFKKRSRAY